ncbi:MAG: glycosyltransferase family 39 protein [Planctomycetia bacterium]|nr:glycosyltransferase family 39 protein [Planctomycetia bacterium]
MNTEKSSERFYTKRFFLIVIALYLLLRLPLNVWIPLLDPSEARYAQICKNMAETGNYLEPQFIYDGELTVFEGKPPLAFQMGAISCRLFGVAKFAVRFPAFLSALLIVCMTYYTARRLRNEKTAIFASLFCVSTIVFYLYAGLCMTDMVLAATVIGMIDSYILFVSEEPGRRKKFYSLGLFVFAGLGMIAKGPVALVMAGLPIFFYILLNRRWRELGQIAWFYGIPLFAVITVPWYWMITQKHPDFLEYFFVNENFKRFLFKDYGDKFGVGRESFRGMAVIWFFLANIPNLVLIFLTFHRNKAAEKPAVPLLSDPLTALPLFGFVTVTLFWSLTSRVLITYLLPTIPCFCLFLAVRLNEQGWFERTGFMAYLRYSSLLFAFVLAGGFIAAVPVSVRYTTELAEPIYRQIETIRSQTPELQNSPIYFNRVTPFSANFHCPEWVVNHGPEKAAVSLENSKNAFFIVREKDQRRDPVEIDRPLLFQSGKWSVYAPERKKLIISD